MESLDDAAKLGSPVSETEKKSVVEIVIKWRRQGFKLYRRWKLKAPVGRPKIGKEIRELIGKMLRENPL